MTARWRDIAERLAEQLATHAFCDAHPVSRPDKDCPFCNDRAAYDAYLRAGGRDFREPPYTGPTIDVHDFVQRDRARQAEHPPAPRANLAEDDTCEAGLIIGYAPCTSPAKWLAAHNPGQARPDHTERYQLCDRHGNAVARKPGWLVTLLEPTAGEQGPGS